MLMWKLRSFKYQVSRTFFKEQQEMTNTNVQRNYLHKGVFLQFFNGLMHAEL